jgi:hypothetical protein
MAILIVAILSGYVLGRGTGGRLSNLGQMTWRAWPLLLLAVGTQMLLGDLPGAFRWAVAVADCLAVATWCGLNRPAGRRLAGSDICGLGVGLNALVMAANGGMPVSRSALGAAGLSTRMNVAHGHLYKHLAMTARSHLRWLGDIIPVPWVHTVLSGGDVFMLVGVAAIVRLAMQPMSGQPSRPAVGVRLAGLATSDANMSNELKLNPRHVG